MTPSQGVVGSVAARASVLTSAQLTPRSATPSLAPPSRGREDALIVAGLAVLNAAWIGLVVVRVPAVRRQRRRVLPALVPVTVTVLCLGMATALTAPRAPRMASGHSVIPIKNTRQLAPVFAPLPDPVQSGSPDSSAALPQPPVAAPTGPAVWIRLIRIEDDIARVRQVLSIAAAGSQTSDTGTRSSDALAQAHRLESAALADERSFYISVAGDQAATAQLTAAAAASGDAEAIAVIGVDLGIVRAELARQQAITDAERALAKVGSLQQPQLAAITARAPFIAPVLGPISQGFGPSPLGFEPPAFEDGTWYPHFHTGLDIAAPLYSPIHVAADGTVLTAGASTDGQGNLLGYGRYVVIAHAQGFVTLYGHLSRISVSAGETVHQGEILGFEGSTGNSTGPHLHFEVRSGGDPIDPTPFVGAQLSA